MEKTATGPDDAYDVTGIDRYQRLLVWHRDIAGLPVVGDRDENGCFFHWEKPVSAGRIKVHDFRGESYIIRFADCTRAMKVSGIFP